MTLPKRRLAALAAPALLVMLLTACGGGAPTDASVEEFCNAYNAEPDLDESLATASPDEQADAIVDALKTLVDDFEEVGTPEDIPDEAREGFEISIDAAKDVNADDVKTALEDGDTDPFESLVGEDDQAKVDAFDTYASDTCSDSSGDEAPSDSES